MLRLFLVALFTSCVFGISLKWSHSERIIGGQLIKPNQAPHHGALFVEKYPIAEPNSFYFTCGVSIISSSAVLTSAQCVKPYAQLRLIVVVGASRLKEYQIKRVDGFSIHYQYSESTLDYDAAVLFLDDILNFDEEIQTIPMAPEGSSINVTSTSMAIGFSAEQDGDFYVYLKQLEMPIVDWDQCHTIYNDIRNVTTQMFCAGNLGRNDSGICNEDFGGSLITDGYLTGISSWSEGCADPNYPTVFVMVSSIRSWIDEQLNSTLSN